MRSDIVTIEP